MDGRIFIWSIEKKYHIKVLDEHTKFVQGITTDPSFEHIISCSNDRTVKVWKAIKSKKCETGFYCYKSLKKYNSKKEEAGISSQESNEKKNFFHIFGDENIPSFFRRPGVSPDGNLIVLPTGQWPKSK